MSLSKIKFNYNIDTISSFPEITSPEIFENKYGKKVFHQDGLFSEQIFGPVNDYQCQCGKYSGREYEGRICERCGVMITSSDMRRKSYAIINLEDIYVFNPLIFPTIVKLIPSKFYNFRKLQSVITSVVDSTVFMFNKTTLVMDVAKRDEITEEDENDENIIIDKGIKFLWMVIKDYWAPILPKLQEFIDEHSDEILINKILVIPPELRPIMKSAGDSSNKYLLSRENKEYVNILKKKQILDKSILLDVRMAPLAKLQDSVFKLFNLIKFGKKQGLVRKHLLAKRVDYSGRAVVVPDPTLKLGYIKVPYIVARQIYGPLILKEVAKRLGMTPYEVVNKNVISDKKYKNLILEILNEQFKNSYVVINRQPTLHRPSIQAHKVQEFIPEDVLAVHGLPSTPMNMDHDGDTIYGKVSLHVKFKDSKKESVVVANMTDLKDLEILIERS